MKKLFVVLFAVSLLFAITGTSMACDGPDCYGSGNFDITAGAGSAVLDGGIKTIPNGVAGGVAGAAGGTVGEAVGHVNNADAEANLHVVGGGLVSHDDYRFDVDADRSIGVGSMSQAEAVTQGHIDVFADADWPNRWRDWKNNGEATGGFVGGAAQGTLDGSLIGESPIFFDTTGFSGGIAGQGSIGNIEGGALAGSCLLNCYGPSSASADAGITMAGNSYSESYRYVNFPERGVKTEGMGTNVGATTEITSYGNDSGLAFTSGGFDAAGGVAAMTVQNGPGLSGAAATAVGSYTGSGQLNCNYNGSVNGSTYTSVTTYDGMKGSINSAGSSMSVSSHTSVGGLD
jgi:hypothetical protein